MQPTSKNFKSQFDDDYAAKGIRDRVFGPLSPNSIVTTDGHERKKERDETFPRVSCVDQKLEVETVESSFQILDQRITEANDIGLQPLILVSVQTYYTNLP
jgi:hypothetical protein